jgi:hypothetical protein
MPPGIVIRLFPSLIIGEDIVDTAGPGFPVLFVAPFQTLVLRLMWSALSTE